MIWRHHEASHDLGGAELRDGTRERGELQLVPVIAAADERGSCSVARIADAYEVCSCLEGERLEPRLVSAGAVHVLEGERAAGVEEGELRDERRRWWRGGAQLA